MIKIVKGAIFGLAVADALGVSKSAIDKSEGWKNRKNDEFVF